MIYLMQVDRRQLNLRAPTRPNPWRFPSGNVCVCSEASNPLPLSRKSVQVLIVSTYPQFFVIHSSIFNIALATTVSAFDSGDSSPAVLLTVLKLSSLLPLPEAITVLYNFNNASSLSLVMGLYIMS